MTDQTNAMLIAELRAFAAGSESARATLMRDAADALEAVELERNNWKLSAEEAERAEKRWEQRVRIAEQRAEAWKRLCESTETAMTEVIEERDQYAAIVEGVRSVIEGESGWFRYRAKRVLDILSASPADALREVKADVWDEGFDAGERDAMEHKTFDEPCIPNPYRAREEER